MTDDKENFAYKKLLFQAKNVEERLNQYPRLRYAIIHHRNIRNQKMSFHNKPYLLEIYKDEAQEIVLQSSVQTGKSEFLIVSALEAAERGLQVLYVMPTIELRNNFVANRIDTLLYRVPYYRMMVSDSDGGSSDARGLKHYGKGAIFFAGSNSNTTFIEKPIDIVLADEVDRFNLSNYALADDRMTASDYKRKYEASNPSVDNYGVNARFRQSDQREWFMKCDHCGHWQPMSWFKNVVRQIDEHNYRLKDELWQEGCGRDIRAYCTKCEGVLNRFTTKGAWVPKIQGVKKTHGYHIHQLLSDFVLLEEMWSKFKGGMEDDVSMQVFYNSMLGLTFAGKGSKITRDILEKCRANYLMPYKCEEPCVMGVDVGKQLNVVIRQILPGEVLRLVYVGRLRDFEDLDNIFYRFKIVGYVIDSMPETRKSIEWAKKLPGRGWICRYHQGLSEVKLNDDERIVSADRTMLMDKVYRSFYNGQRLLPSNASSLDDGQYYSNLETPTRIKDDEKNRYDWIGDPDHYFHAEVYCTLAYVGRGEFKVVGLPVNAPLYEAIPNKLDESIFPPGTPTAIIEHYRNLLQHNQGSCEVKSWQKN